MIIDLKKTAELLLENDDILIVSHKSPDGDTTGSAHALYYALKQIGKKVAVCCSDDFSKNFAYMYDEDMQMDLDYKFVVSVDIADTQLLGEKYSHLSDRINLCIDHHVSNKFFAKYNYVDVKSASTCEIIFDVLTKMKTEFTPKIADCIYTGVITDTGCFKFSNTTPKTHIIAAKLFEYGCAYEKINRDLFETKTKNRFLIEKTVLDNMEFYCDNRVAVIEMPTDIIEKNNIDESELDGVSGIPRQIEGVEVGVMFKKKTENCYKISVRTAQVVDASKLCSTFGGGGHKRAAGCMISKSLDEAKKDMIDEIKKHLGDS